jgi:hypothetical protein
MRSQSPERDTLIRSGSPSSAAWESPLLNGVLASELADSSGPAPLSVRSTTLTIPTSAGNASGLLLKASARPLGRIVLVDGFTALGAPLEKVAVFAAKLADRTGCAVLVPDLAAFPVRKLDAMADHVATCAQALVEVEGPVSEAVVLIGDGVGASLALTAAGRLAREGNPDLAHLGFVSPLMPSAIDEPEWVEFWSIFAADPDSPCAIAEIDPARVAGIYGLSATVLSGGSDAHARGAELLAASLRSGGVAVEERVFVDADYAFLRRLHERVSEAAFQVIVRAIRSAVFIHMHDNQTGVAGL